MPTKDRADIAHLVRALDVIVSGACLCVVGRSVATHFALSVANSTSSLRPIPRGYRSTTIIIVTSCIFDALFYGAVRFGAIHCGRVVRHAPGSIAAACYPMRNLTSRSPP